MSRLPIPVPEGGGRAVLPIAPRSIAGADAAADTVDVADLVRSAARGWRSVLAGGLVGLLIAAALVMFFPPRYRTVSSVLVRNANDPTSSVLSRFGVAGDALGSSGGALGNVLKSPLETELQLLKSRDVLGQVVDSLGLQAQVLAPRGVSSFALVQPARYPGSFRRVDVEFDRAADGSYRTHSRAGDTVARPGVASALPVVGAVTLASGAALPPHFEIRFEDREDATTRVADRLSVSKRGGELVELVYYGPDSITAARVPNAIADVYLARRRTVDRGYNQRKYEFLTAQADSVAGQLGRAEQALRAQQEASGVFDPEVVGRSAADALRTVEQQIGALDAERLSIRDAVGQVERGEIAPRRLTAFPSLLRSPAVNNVFTQITNLETERTQLLERRTERDPQVITLGRNVSNLESQLLPLARTYEASLDRQTAELRRQRDAVMGQLGSLPAEAQGALRRQRDVKLLSQTAAGLQAQVLDTRLAAISEGGQVRQVDAAIAPKKIFFPRPLPTVAVSLVLGVLAGTAWAMLGTGLKSRVAGTADAERATGLPTFEYRAGGSLLGASAWTGTVVLVPVPAGAVDTARLAADVGAQVAERGRRVAVIDLHGTNDGDGNGAVTGAAAVDAAEAGHDLVVVNGVSLDDRRTVGVLDPSRAVLLCAPASHARRAALVAAADALARGGVPCVGVVLVDAARRGPRTGVGRNGTRPAVAATASANGHGGPAVGARG